MDSTKGYIHVYTGNGKGKTTAAFGLAVRALCAGKSVYIGQFVKSMRYNETKIGQLFDQVKIEQLGRGCFIGKDPEAIDIRMARDGLTRCAALLESGEYDVVILDELTIALHFGLLTIDAVLDALNRRHPAVEVVVTGRYAPQELIDAADLVTEMREIKHYLLEGLPQAASAGPVGGFQDGQLVTAVGPQQPGNPRGPVGTVRLEFPRAEGLLHGKALL